MIVSRFTSFTKNFVICCYQDTNIFCSRCGCASAFSAKGPCYVGPYANVAVSVLREMSMNTVLTRYHFSPRLWKLTHEKNSRVRPCVLELFRPQDLPWIILTILAGHATGLPVLSRCPHFFFVFLVSVGSGDGSPHARSLALSLRVDAGHNVGITASCGGDAGDVGVAELEEPVDKPRTTIGT